MLLARTQSSLYMRRQDYWGPPYFFEQLLRDRAVLMDDNASVVVMPYMLDPMTDASVWMSGMQRRGGLLPEMERPLLPPAGGGDDRQRPILVLKTVYERWNNPRRSDPAGGFLLQNTGLPDETGAALDIAVPLHDLKLMPDIRSFRGRGSDANAAALVALPALQATRRPLFDTANKTLELFFVGRTKHHMMPPPCRDSHMFFVADPERCPCLYLYSECIRQYFYYNYRDTPGVFVRDSYLEPVRGRNLSRSDNADILAEEWAVGERQRSAAFCLVPGGHNFDMVRGAGGGGDGRLKRRDRVARCIVIFDRLE